MMFANAATPLAVLIAGTMISAAIYFRPLPESHEEPEAKTTLESNGNPYLISPAPLENNGNPHSTYAASPAPPEINRNIYPMEPVPQREVSFWNLLPYWRTIYILPARETVPGPEIKTQEDLRKFLDEWERIWFLDQPSHMRPLRTHSGII